MAKYAPPEGYTLDETSGKYYSSATGADPETGAPIQWVTWFDANTGEYTQHMYPAEQQTVAPQTDATPQTAAATQPAKKSGKMAAIIVAAVVLLLGGAFGGHFAGLYTLPFLPAEDSEYYSEAYYPEEEPALEDSGYYVETYYPEEEPEPVYVPLGTMLGIYTSFMSPEIADYYGLVVGYWVSYVLPEIAGDRAGMMPGDIITAIGRVRMDNPYVMLQVLDGYRAGDITTMTVWRDNRELALSAALDGIPSEGLPEVQQDRDFVRPISPHADPAAALVGTWRRYFPGVHGETFAVEYGFHSDGRFYRVTYLPPTGDGFAIDVEYGTFTIIAGVLHMGGGWLGIFPDGSTDAQPLVEERAFTVRGDTLDIQYDFETHRYTRGTSSGVWGFFDSQTSQTGRIEAPASPRFTIIMPTEIYGFMDGTVDPNNFRIVDAWYEANADGGHNVFITLHNGDSVTFYLIHNTHRRFPDGTMEYIAGARFAHTTMARNSTETFAFSIPAGYLANGDLIIELYVSNW